MVKKTGRNDPCPCNSGKKYKKCCAKQINSLDNVQVSSDPQPPTRPQVVNESKPESPLHLMHFIKEPFDDICKRFDLLRGGSSSKGESNHFSAKNFRLFSVEDGMILNCGAIDRTVKITKSGAILFREGASSKDTLPVLRLLYGIMNSKTETQAWQRHSRVKAAFRILNRLLPASYRSHDAEDKIAFVGMVCGLVQSSPPIKPKIKDGSLVSLKLSTPLSSNLEDDLEDQELGCYESPFELRNRPVVQKWVVRFYFSDGTCLDTIELCEHPYFSILPKDYLVNCTDDSLIKEYISIYSFDDYYLKVNLAQVLWRGGFLGSKALCNAAKLFFVVDGVEGKSGSIKCLEVSGFVDAYATNQAWIVTPTQIMANHTKGDGMVHLGQHYYYDLNQNKFVFWDPSPYFDRCSSFRVGAEPLDSLPPKDPNFGFKFAGWQSAKSLNAWIADARLQGQKVDLSQLEKADLPQITFSIDSEKRDEIKIEVPRPANHFSINYSSHHSRDPLSYVLASFGVGIEAYSRKIREFKIEFGWHKFFRKIVSHRGFALALLAEVTKYYIDTPSVDLKSAKKLTEDQVKEHIHSLAESSGFHANDLKKQEKNFIKKVKNELYTFVAQIIDEILSPAFRDYDEVFFLGNQPFRENPYKWIMPTFFHLISMIAEATKGRIFQTARTKSFTWNLMNEGETDKFVIKFNFKDAFSFALRSEIPVANLLVNGRKLHDLNESDLKTEMKLNESSEGTIDWFDLHPGVFLKGKPVSIKAIQNLARDRWMEFEGSIYRLPVKAFPTIKWLNYFWKNLKGPGDRDQSGFSKIGHSLVEQERSQTLTLLALKEAGMSVVGGASWKKICAAYEQLQNRQSTSSGVFDDWLDKLEIPLKDFQKQGVQWMKDLTRLQLGGILADDMGLGKTVQTLALIKNLVMEKEAQNILIVVPTSLVYNWQSEMRKFTPDLESRTVLSGKQAEEVFGEQTIPSRSSQSPQIWMSTYGVFTENIASFQNVAWDVVIFDEAQQLKNIRSRRTSAARSLAARIKFALTGTPMENHYGEFYSLIDLVTPGALGPYDEFMKKYLVSPTHSGLSDAFREDVEFLRLKTAPLVMRRSKSIVLNELPDKTESDVLLAFDKVQSRLYKNVAIKWNNEIKERIKDGGESKVQVEMLTALLRLRQICSCPQSVPKLVYKKRSPKFELLTDRLIDLLEKKESVLVFAHFRATLDLLNQDLQEQGLRSMVITGRTPIKERVAKLKEFDDSPEPIVLLMTQKVGGVGLNLTRASYVFHLEPWWNPAVENQATDRAHRMGQKRAVQVYRYIMQHSVEEKIQKLKKRKSDLFEALLHPEDHAELTVGTRGLSQKDFQFLLS